MKLDYILSHRTPEKLANIRLLSFKFTKRIQEKVVTKKKDLKFLNTKSLLI